MAITAAVIGAAAAVYSSKQQQKAADKAAKAANQPTNYDRTTEQTPWGPSAGIRENIANAAWGLWANRGGGGAANENQDQVSARRQRKLDKQAARRAKGEGGGGKGRGGPVGAPGYIRDILEGKYLKDGNPYLAGVIDPAQRGIDERIAAEKLRLSQGNSMYGSTGQLKMASLERQRGEAEMQIRQQDYESRMGDLMQALGYGTNYDIANMQDKTARRGQTLSHGAAMAGINLQRQMLPYQQLGSIADIVQTATGGYGTTHQYGTEQGPQRAPEYVDTAGNVFKGAVGGYQLGSQGYSQGTGKNWTWGNTWGKAA